MGNKQEANTLKVAIIESGLDVEFREAHKKAYFKDDTSGLESIRHYYGLDVFKACDRLSQSRYKRKQRVAKRLGEIIKKGQCSFVTLTFNDETLKSTSQLTRRKYVSRYLKSQSLNYVANIDYGDKKKNPQSHEREHYHALVQGTIDRSLWTYGFIGVTHVKDDDLDVTRTAKYVAKLSNHAMKVNNGVAPHLIYSSKREFLEPPSWLFDKDLH